MGDIWQLQGVLEWLHLQSFPVWSLTPFATAVATLIIKGRTCTIQLLGQELQSIIVPFSKEQHTLWKLLLDWQMALANFPGQTDCHYPSDPIVQFACTTSFIFPKVISSKPIPNATVVFTNGSSNGHAEYWTQSKTKVISNPPCSAQRTELCAVGAVLTDFQHQPINIYLDSLYVVSVIKGIETAILGNISQKGLSHTFSIIQDLVHRQKYPLFICHIRSHTSLLGALSSGNHQADG